jgi:hypothetical protein
VHENEIHVGGHVQLPPAELAHADDHQLLFVERGADRHLREVAHRAADLAEVRQSAKVARDEAQQHPLAQPPQAAHERRLVVLARPFERRGHLRARERRRRGELARELGMRREHARGIARIGDFADFANRIRHLPLE